MKAAKFVWIIVLALAAAAVYGQSDTALLSGFVKDSSGAVIASATVTVTNVSTGAVRKVFTTEAGYYVVTSLPSGEYDVAVEAAGFKRFISTRKKVDANVPATVDALLEVGAVTESVEVSGQATTVQADTATVGKLVASEQIDKLMINGRNPLYLTLLKAGSRNSSLNGLGALGFGVTLGFSFNGSRYNDSLITSDGAVATRTRGNENQIGVSDQDSIQEIQILTSNYNAQYGRSIGAQIRMVTKSGGRDFHGGLYEYFRNNHLDANSWALNRTGSPRAVLKFNQFGYNFSGPVYIPGKWNSDRNKLFFLWSEEWVRYRPESTGTQTVTTAAMRTGDFSELLNPANNFFGRTRVVNDPTSGAPFPNNIIPANRVSPNGLAFMKPMPLPTPGFWQGNSNFIGVSPAPADQRKDTFSFDFLPMPKHTFRLRLQNYAYYTINATFGPLTSDINRPNKTSSLNYIWTPSPTVVNELTLGASADRIVQNVLPRASSDRTQYGIDYPFVFPVSKDLPNKIPTVVTSNFTTMNGNRLPAWSSGPIYTISDNLTKVHGTHTFMGGVNFERSGENDRDQVNFLGVPGGNADQNGAFTFDDLRAGAPSTGLAIANQAMGLFTNYSELGEKAYTPFRGQMFEWFAQDSWKATSRLRLELGVRHTIQTPYYYSLWGNIAQFDPRRYDPSKAVVQDPATGYILSGDKYNGIVIPGTSWPAAAKGRIPIASTGEFNRLFSGGSSYWGQIQKLNFQPRIGIAYQISHKVVLRSGVGKFYSRPPINTGLFVGANPPFQPTAGIATGLADNPAGGKPANFPIFFQATDPVFKTPNSYSWNTTVESEIGFDTTLSVAYVGRVALNLERNINVNTLAPGALFLPQNTGVNVNALRPYRGFEAIVMAQNAGRAQYNGLQIEANRRFSKGLSFGVAYTLSKALDNVPNRFDQIWNPGDNRNYWGPADTDSRHIAVINFIYELPFFKQGSALTKNVLGGWQTSGLMQFQTGQTFSVTTGEDFAGIGSGTNVQAWTVNGNPYLARGDRAFSQGPADQNYWFRVKNSDGAALFTPPARGTFSNQTRDAFNQPGFQNWNIAIFKDFIPREGHKLEFRSEFFNWLNHPNWNAADINPRSSTFGKVTAKSSQRNVQLSLRYRF